MARTKEQIVSEMVDSGLFTDDEIRQAVAVSGGMKNLPEKSTEVLMGVPSRGISGAAQMVQRLGRDTLEGFAPPMSMESAKRLINPNIGQFGPNRFSQEVIDAAAENANKQAENFVQLPGVNKFPRLAALVGTGGALGAAMIPSPKSMQQAVGMGKMVNKAIQGEMALRAGAGNLGKAVISTASPASLEAVNARFENPSAVKNAMTREQLGTSVVSSAKRLSEQIRELDAAAKATLSGEKNIPKEELVKTLGSLKARYTGQSGQAISGEARSAIAEIENTINGIKSVNPLPNVGPGVMKTEEIVPGVLPVKKEVLKGIPGATGRTEKYISEKQVKDIMDQFKNTNWNDPAKSAKKDVRKALDAVLKARNEGYTEAMKPVAERTKLQKLVNKKLSLQYDPTTGTYSTDATTGKWTPKLLEGKRPETSQALKKLGQLTDNDLMNKARMTNFREQFTGGKTQGSRMVQLGKHVAGMPGAVLGAAIDKMGGNISAALIDTLAKVPSLPSLSAKAQKNLVIALSNAVMQYKRNKNAKR